MKNTDMISIVLTVGTGILGVVMLYIQYIINKRSEKKETEIKYNSKNVNSIPDQSIKDDYPDDNKETSGITEDYLHILLESYHTQALQQANTQFWFSIVASTLGFVFIFAIIFLEEDRTWYEYILKTFPGVIVQIISALFITQAKETRERATELFKELNYDNKIGKSVEIADTIENNDIKSDIKAKIALHIIGMDNKDAHQT